MVAQPPPRRSARSVVQALAVAGLVAGGLGYLAHVWPDPEPFPVATPAEHVQLMTTLSGGPAQVGGDEARCLAFLDEWLRQPGWEVTVTRGWNGWERGSGVDHQLTVDADGDAVWSAPGMVDRVMHVSPLQISMLHAAARRSCRPDRERSAVSIWYEVRRGGADAPARRVRDSAAAAQLHAFVADVTASDLRRRRAERALSRCPSGEPCQLAPRRPQWSLSRMTSK